MEKNIKQQLLNSMGRLYEEAKGCQLKDSFFERVDDELSVLAEYFGTGKSQAFLVSMIFVLNYKGNTVDYNDLIRYFECNPVKILEYSDDFDNLCAKGILEKQKSTHRVDLSGANDQFVVNKRITEAILQNKPMPEIKSAQPSDVIDLLEQLYNFGEQRDDEEIETYELFRLTKNLLLNNTHFPLIKKVLNFNYSTEDTYLYLFLIWKTISGTESVDISRTLEGIYDNPSRRFRYLEKILKKENPLVKDQWIETVEARFFNDTEMKLTDKSLDLLSECGIKIFVTKKKQDNVLEPEKIPYKKLFFDKENMQQLFLLNELLDDAKLKKTQNRLAQKNLPKGITVLLYGAPGTGKTEVVKQIAKKTNRQLMQVDISQSKSMWFGESEKIIKRLFTNYKSFAKDCERTPILFFNEADAIISKRRPLGSPSNVAQTENAIQNILLEELENFEGILIATTNLANNLDSAFERRFLFKIRFNKPDLTIRSKIWKSKWPYLKSKEYKQLAEQFDFSGGQIDNVIRKCEIHEIIYGEKVTFEDIVHFCLEEKIADNRTQKTMGFRK